MAVYNNNSGCPGMCHAGIPSNVSTNQVASDLLKNDHSFMFLTPSEARTLLAIEMRNRGKISERELTQMLADVTWDVASNAGNIDTAVSIGKLVKDLSAIGAKAYVKQYMGKSYIILKGYPGARTILSGTRYGLLNPKVIQMGLGKLGAVKSAKGGGIITVIAVSAYRIVEFFLKDEMTLVELIGTLATDVAKIAIATGVSIWAVGAVAGAATVATFAIGPLVAVLAVGYLTAEILNWVDDKLNITGMVIEGLQIAVNFTSEQMVRIKNTVVDLGRKTNESVTRKLKKVGNAAVDSATDYMIDRIEDYIVRKVNDLLWSLPKVTPR